MEKKQTAVEWLVEQLECFGNKHELQMSWATLYELREQAKQMEKEQIEEAIDSIEIVHRYYYKDGTFGDDYLGKEVSSDVDREYYGLSNFGEQYYNETYG